MEWLLSSHEADDPRQILISCHERGFKARVVDLTQIRQEGTEKSAEFYSNNLASLTSRE